MFRASHRAPGANDCRDAVLGYRQASRGIRGAGSGVMARTVVNAMRSIDLRWVRIEIGLLVGALFMGG